MIDRFDAQVTALIREAGGLGGRGGVEAERNHGEGRAENEKQENEVEEQQEEEGRGDEWYESEREGREVVGDDDEKCETSKYVWKTGTSRITNIFKEHGAAAAH